MPVVDNQDEYLQDLARQLPAKRTHTLEFENSMEYADPLHNKEGYYVFNDSHMVETVSQWLRELVESKQPLDVRHVEMALDGAGFEEVGFLRSYTGAMRPPVRAGQGERAAHPGGWSDITGNLKAGYSHRVNGGRWKSEGEYE